MAMNICIDFDGVIHRYSRGWVDGTIYDPPVDGTESALSELLHNGHKVIIFSTRAFEQAAQMQEWLAKHHIPYSGIHMKPGKPMAHIYLDDRALTFKGQWAKSIEDIRNFKVWTDKPKTTMSEPSKETPPLAVPSPEIFKTPGIPQCYPLSQSQEEDLAKRFTYHAPKDTQPCRYVAIRDKAKELATLIMQCTPQSREQSLAITKIEEASMWANAAIARNE